ncbi:MAG: hypothetical protein HOO88_05660 [Kiritimatiellaceae bacterium]|nr:hypothetical protein [Kiritimatiellaceae bacterium]
MKAILSNVRATLVVALLLGSSAQAQQWILDGQRIQALEIHVSDPQAVYTDGSRQMTAPLKFAQSLTATNGALQIYAKDSEDHHGYFKTLSFQDGLQFSTSQSDALLFGVPADGLLVSPNTLMHLGYGTTIDFETGTLTGSAGAKWHVTENPTDALGIVNKGYADGRYLLRTTGITTNRVIQAGNTLVISNGLITAIIP